MSESTYPEVQIIYEHGEPQGIRDRGGFLLHFNSVQKYLGQEERYRQELVERFFLADRLLQCLQEATND